MVEKNMEEKRVFLIPCSRVREAKQLLFAWISQDSEETLGL